MKEHPILFSGPMVHAILEGRKTQTRRVLRDQPCKLQDFNRGHLSIRVRGSVYQAFSAKLPPVRCPYGQPGDRLWVRESHWMDRRDPLCAVMDVDGFVVDTHPASSATGTSVEDMDALRRNKFWRKRPSIHMPRWASRITLEITGVRVERLRDISEDDAIAEGIERDTGMWRHYGCPTQAWIHPRDSYRSLWESINGPGSWDANPFVWAVEFRRVTP